MSVFLNRYNNNIITTLIIIFICVNQVFSRVVISGEERMEMYLQLHKPNVEQDIAFLLNFSLPKHISHVVVLDIGSNIGLFSECLIFGLTANRSCTYDIALFEPVDEYYHIGKKRLQKISNMTTHFMYGISDVKEERYINVNTGPNLGDNSFLDTNPNFPQMDSHTRRIKNIRILTKTITLDEFMEPLYPRLKHLDLLKVDVEGFEGNVLKGSIKTIYRYLPDMYIEIAWGTRHPAYKENLKLYNELLSLGYFITDSAYCFDYLPLLNVTVNYLWRHKSKENDKLFTVGLLDRNKHINMIYESNHCLAVNVENSIEKLKIKYR